MANYTPTFSKPYPNGWVDKPSKTTPATAAIMNSYDTAIAALESYLRDNAIKNVSASTTVKSGTKTATITIDGTEYVIYSPSVSYESAITGGTKVGTITVGSNTFDVYAPASSAGGSNVSVVPKTLTGTNIAEITVDGTTYQLYAPTGGGGGSTVTAEATLTEGTQIGKITIDGKETILYAPTASPITVDAELSATSENAVQNKAIAEEFQKYANGTNVVAKATEAETAKTAASATTAQSATTAESATKATQDAQGNVINETYAKKTEVPQGTVVDDALSSTSANPVQNKVVKDEFDQINSNLEQLEYSDVAGGKNLFGKPNSLLNANFLNGIMTCNTPTNVRGDFSATALLKDGTRENIIISAKYESGHYYGTCPITQNTDRVILLFSGDKLNASAYFDVSNFEKETYCLSFDLEYSYTNCVIKNIQFEKGLTSTDYKPYIPSVKMLADEVNQQNDSLNDVEFLGWSVPSECPIQNYVDSNGNFHQRVGRIDLGSLDWRYANGYNTFFTDIYDNKEQFGKCYMSKYNFSNDYYPNAKDKSYGFILDNDVMFGIKDTSYTDTTDLKNSLQGIYLYYELATEKIISVGNEPITELKSDLSNTKDGTTPVAKAVADEDGNNIKSTYAKKTETFEIVTEDVNVVLNSDLFDSTNSDITCVRIGKLCVLSFTIYVPAQKYIPSTIDKIVLMSIVGTKYQPKKLGAGTGRRQIFQGFAVGNYDENGKQSQSLNNTVRIITSSDSNYTEIITRDKDRLNWRGYVQGQIMWVTD